MAKTRYFISNGMTDGWFFNTEANIEKDTTLTPYQQRKAIKKLKELNIKLPEPKDPVGAYVASKIVGNLIFISGQLPLDSEGKLIKGKVGKELRDVMTFLKDSD